MRLTRRQLRNLILESLIPDLSDLPIPGEEMVTEAIDEVIEAVTDANEELIAEYIKECAIEIVKDIKWPTEARVRECVEKKVMANAQKHLMVSFKAVYDLFLEKLTNIMGIPMPDISIPGF